MSLGRVLVEEFQPEVLKWLRERVELVVVNPWVEPQRWELEVVRVDGVISRKGKISREQMKNSGGRLKIIARTGVGVDPSRVDLEAAKEFKVWVTNQPGSNAVSVAELVFGQMIALVRHTHAADRAVKENRWSDYLKFIGTELAGKTLGIVGMGNIGARLALRARAFEMDLLVYDPYIPESHVTSLGRQVGRLERSARRCGLRDDSLPAQSRDSWHDRGEGISADETVGLFDQRRARRHRPRGGAIPSVAAEKDRRIGVGRDCRRTAEKRSSVI